MVHLLSKLAGNLKVHLAMEDEAVYPMLLEHKDPEIRSLAQKYMIEMGGLKDAFIEYIDKWTKAFAIQQNPEEFVEATKGIFDALGKRIEKEDSELYILVDEAA